MECFFGMDDTVVGTPSGNGRAGDWLTDDGFKCGDALRNIINQLFVIPVSASRLPGVMIPGMQTGFMNLGGLCNDCRVGLANLFSRPCGSRQ